ncbi:tetratricopeptide repeat protein [Mucilaginibacter sp. BJC16-A38]|uniref:tetratricopeptide repeat protein n=1 Tax=Mucilaginibacter phenanthrenivorans TaxID=1234842 RepID=UPI002157C472|nr:tetratricopeptide repeat protein [Mucilaginibacter phenanthrenivorans]MCR8557149.1 tetratricopeptide repeat protein [Mucilaginibacter phenanthrenivorans]
MRKLIFVLLITAVCGVLNKASAQNQSITDSIKRVRATQQRIDDITLALKNNGTQITGKANMYVFLGNEEVTLKHYGKAIIDYSNALAVNPNLGLAYLSRGDAYRFQKDFQKAEADYKHAVDHLNGDNINQGIAYYYLGMFALKAKQFDKAMADDSVAIALNPNYAPAYRARADLYGFKGKFQLAINDISVAMYGYQNNPILLSSLLTTRGDLKRDLKQYKEAINDYSLALKLNQNNGHAYWNQAACYNVNGDYQLAFDGYNKAIPFFKNSPSALARLYDDRALMEMGLQKYREAIADDSLAILTDTSYAAAYINKGNAHAQNADYKQSNEDFERAILHFRNNKFALVFIYTSIGHNNYFLNEYQNVIDNCSKAIAFNIPNWNSYFERGRAYLKLNNKELAINDFKQVMVVDTSKQSAEYAFALFYTGNPDKAVEVMQNSFLKTTNSFVLLGDYYNMACLFSIMNKPEQAEIYLKKCIDGGYNKKYALTDSDFDNIKNTEEFKNIIAGK